MKGTRDSAVSMASLLLGQQFRKALEHFVTVMVLVNPPPTDKVVRFEAARQLVRKSIKGKSPSLRDPEAQWKLRRLARTWKESPETVLERWLWTGVILAASDFSRPREIRLGQAWVKSEDQSVACIPPGDLNIPQFSRWLLQEAYKAATATALDQAYPPTSEDSVNPTISFDEERMTKERTTNETVLDSLVAAERQNETREILLTLKGEATPREREILNLLESGVDPLDRAASLKLRPSTIRVHLFNLRKKAHRIKVARGL